MAMSPLETLGFALGTSFASGLNLYATVAAAGLFQRFGIVQLPPQLQVLSHPIVLGIAIALFVIEFIADKIPYVDTVWDAVHTFIRPPAAAANMSPEPLSNWILSLVEDAIAVFLAWMAGAHPLITAAVVVILVIVAVLVIWKLFGFLQRAWSKVMGGPA